MSLRRTESGMLDSQPKPREPLLVREAPDLVTLECALTDGKDGYRVVDVHRRHGVRYFKLVNVNAPELANWFNLEQMGELAFARGEKRANRDREVWS